MTFREGDVVRVTMGQHARRCGTVAAATRGYGRDQYYVDLYPYGKLEAEEDVLIDGIFLAKAESRELVEGEVKEETELMALIASVYELCREKETECLQRIATGCQKTDLDLFKEPEQIRAELQGTKDQARRVMMLIHDAPLWPVLQQQIEQWAVDRRGQNSTGVWGWQ